VGAINERVDEMRMRYPAVARLLGATPFADAVSTYLGATAAAAQPPGDPAGFERFLAGFLPGDELPYLPGVARLDRFWNETHEAPEAIAADPHALAALPVHELMRVTLRAHPSARWCWFDRYPVVAIWRRSREGSAEGATGVTSSGEGALVVRTNGVVRCLALNAPSYAFLQACAAGGTLADAAAAALAVDADADADAAVDPLLDAGALVRVPGAEECGLRAGWLDAPAHGLPRMHPAPRHGA
jgi:hypothetical protein